MRDQLPSGSQGVSRQWPRYPRLAAERPADRPRRSVRHHRPFRCRQEHPAAPDQPSGGAHRRPHRDRRRRRHRAGRGGPAALPPAGRNDLPALQPAVVEDRRRQRRPAAEAGRAAVAQCHGGTGGRAAGAGRPQRARGQIPGATVRRAEAAGRHRPRPGHRAEDPAVRRGDQRPRPADHCLGVATAGADQPRAEPDHSADHPRNGRDPPDLRPRGGDGRRRDRRAGLGGRGLTASATRHQQTLRPGSRTGRRRRTARRLRPCARAHPAPDLPGPGYLRAAARHGSARDRGGLQHPRRAHRPHQGHPLRPVDPGPDRRRPGRRAGALCRRRRAHGGAALMEALLTRLLPNVDWAEIGYASLDTLSMLGGSLLFTVLLGLPLGVLLFLTGPRQMFEQKALYGGLSLLVNILRSVPFVILLILMIPFTVLVTGTSLGVAGAIPPLVVGATPFFARLVETALREVDRGIIEATQAMGASTRQIVVNALLPEALPGIFAAVTVTAITLVSYTAMSGLIGGGGLGDLAVRYGYQRYQPDVMAVTVILLLVLVQILQSVGDRLVVHFSRK